VAGGRDPFEDLGGGFALVDIAGAELRPDEPTESRLSVLQSRVCCCRFFENHPIPYRTLVTLWNTTASAQFRCPPGAQIRVLKAA